MSHEGLRPESQPINQQEGTPPASRKNFLEKLRAARDREIQNVLSPSDYIVALGILGLVAWGVQDTITSRRAQQFVTPQGATEVLPPAASKHRLIRVYEGQSTLACPQGIERLANLIDGNGDFRGEKVICNPDPAQRY